MFTQALDALTTFVLIGMAVWGGMRIVRYGISKVGSKGTGQGS